MAILILILVLLKVLVTAILDSLKVLGNAFL